MWTGESIGASHNIVVAVVCATLTMACSGDFPTVRTCQGLRGLKHGMTTEEVISLLGPPRHQASAPGCGHSFQSAEPVTQCWTYGSENLFNGNLTVELTFDKQGLASASGYHDYFWSGDARQLFYVDSAGTKVDSEFARRFACNTTSP